MLKKYVALKIFNPECGVPRREAAILQEILDPNVVRIYDICAENGPPWFYSMEYLKGGTLRQFLNESGPAPIERCLEIMQQMASGLAAIHAKGIVHRDLKPENTFLGEDGTIKIVDFGHARLARTMPEADSKIEIGTPLYAPPEAKDLGPYDYTWDIYSFGMVFYEILEGKRPLREVPLLFNREDVPEDLQRIIRKCLERDPSGRFAAGEELKAALLPAAPLDAGRPVETRVWVRLALTAGLVCSIVIWLGLVAPEWNTRPEAHRSPVAGVVTDRIKPAVIDRHEIKTEGPFEDGVRFLKEDLPEDALKAFDRTVLVDPKYPGVQYQRGLALAKLRHWDDAIAALKSAIPASESERIVTAWGWDAGIRVARPTPAATSPTTGVILAMDMGAVHGQRDVFELEKAVSKQKGVVYGETDGQGTVLYFADLVHRDVIQRTLPGAKVRFPSIVSANDSVMILRSVAGVPAKPTFHAFSSNGDLLWEKVLDFEPGSDTPLSGLLGDRFYLYWVKKEQLELFDSKTGRPLWVQPRGGIAMGYEPPLLAHTGTDGDILIARSHDVYHAMRVSDGKDAWTVPAEGEHVTELLSGRLLIVFDQARRIFMVDVETGAIVYEVKMPQYVDKISVKDGGEVAGYKHFAGAVVEGNTLYVVSEGKALYAIALPGERRAGVVRWHTPLGVEEIQSIHAHRDRIYIGTNGDLIVLTGSGKIIAKTNPTGKKLQLPVRIEYADDRLVLARWDKTLYALNRDGDPLWSFKAQLYGPSEAIYFNGTVTVFTSAKNTSMLDIYTGEVLKENAGRAEGPAFVFKTGGEFFIADQAGVKELSIHSRPLGPTDKQIYAELARTYLAKNDLEQAQFFVNKTSAIDDSYPPLILVRAHLFKARGKAEKAGVELMRYLTLPGLDPKEADAAIAELKRDHGRLWVTPIGRDVAGDPVVIENRLVSVGRRSGRELHIIALDPQTGKFIWSQAASRFVSSVAAVYDRRAFLWYVTDPGVLYRVDIQTGKPELLAALSRRATVDQAWITYGSGRVCVATSSRDLQKATSQIGVDCFDAARGSWLWGKSFAPKLNTADVVNPVRTFVAENDSLTYSIGSDRWTVSTKDGSALPAVRRQNAASPVTKRDRLYALNPAGLAYSTNGNK